MSLTVHSTRLDNPLISSEKIGDNGVTGDFSSLLRHQDIPQSDAAAELAKYFKMSPGERLAVAMRKQLGISEDEYAAMTPEQKQVVDAKVADLIKQKMDEEMAKQHAHALKSGITL